MKQLYLTILSFLIFSDILGQTNDLNVMSTSGGITEASGLNLCWTMGEVFADIKKPTGYILQEGFHQGFTIIQTETDQSNDLGLTIFPNPLKETLNIKMSIFNPGEHFIIDIYNSQGILLNKLVSNSSITEVDFSSLPSSAYMVKITYNEGKYQVYKIIKE